MPCAVILTALPVEYLAVCNHLTDLKEEMNPQGTIYERGVFAGYWDVGIAEIGIGNVEAAIEVGRAIDHFKPDILLFVGVAGGIKNVAIGDVVAATKIYGYESGKVGDNHFSTRPELGNSTYALVQRAKREAKKDDWLGRLDSEVARKPRVFVGAIAAGEKVVASKQSGFFNFLQSSYNDALAVDMEGYGFLSAAFAHPDIKSIVIRGISDLLEGKNDDGSESEDDRQERASRHASAFAFQILKELVDKSHPDSKFINCEEGIPLKNVDEHIITRQEVSYQPPLLDIPDYPDFFGRAEELQDLENLVRLNRVVVIVGDPGVGKTYLSSKLVKKISSEYEILRIHKEDVGITLDELLSSSKNFLTARNEYGFNTTYDKANSENINGNVNSTSKIPTLIKVISSSSKPYLFLLDGYATKNSHEFSLIVIIHTP
jgi:nucleoside phosphorylase